MRKEKQSKRNKTNKFFYLLLSGILIFSVAVMFLACDGGGGSFTHQEGVFLDSPVEGLEYQSGIYSGVTDSKGSFTFAEGETVTFSIGAVMLGEAPAKPLMTPLDLVEEAVDENHQAVVNIARFVQSLDTDGDINDFIDISDEVRAVLTNARYINFDQTAEDFTNDPNVKALFKELNASNVFTNGERTLCGAEEALAHLRATLSANPVITVKSPNGKEFVSAASSFEITWKAPSSIDNVMILLSQDGGETWNETPIVSSTPNDGSFVWDSVPISVHNTQNRIRIIDVNNQEVYDDSNGNFTILLPQDELAEIILGSDGTDTDGDHLPDDLEVALGTDPEHPDSDRDGIGDYEEIMGGQSFGSYEGIPDLDQDGIIAALDTDDNGDGIHDGEGIDFDGDGIFNYLELNGYTYNWYTDSYALWDEVSFDKPYFKSDPRQVSSDQDPYSDDMEASGRLMDVLVESPGDLPMVPAYPNIVVILEGYEVTLNSEITIGEGGSLSRESNWSRQTSREHSSQWEVNASTTHTVKITKEGGYEGSVTIGGSYGETNTTGSSSSRGGSITTDQNWQKATSTNPAEAARVKLKLKAYNYGTAAASNVLPTLTLRIGGMSVLTFQPADPIHILEPGGVYPPQDGTYWVVESKDDGSYIYITMDELRAIELGAPVSISVTQMQSEVMLLNDDGQWESAGDWGQYMARCDAVSSNIMFDLGNGHFIHHLVYSDDSASAPQVTLGDALHWIAGFHAPDGQPHIKYYDPFDMEEIVTPLDGFSFMIDHATLADNGWVINDGQLTHPNADTFYIDDIVLGPNSIVLGKTSPDALNETGPTIYYAYYDQKFDRAVVLASDYIGVDNVMFSTAVGPDDDVAMEEYLGGSGYYQLDEIQWMSIDGSPMDCCNASCTAVATNAHGETIEAAVTCLEYDRPEPVKPEITAVSVNRAEDPSDLNIDINVDVIESPDWPVTSVWLYNPNNPTTPIELAEDLDYWSGSTGHWFTKTTAIAYEELEGSTIVAELDLEECPVTNPSCYDTFDIRARDMGAVSSGSGKLINREEHYVIGYQAFYSYIDFYKPSLLEEQRFDHKTNGVATGWYDCDSRDNAISAYPNAEVFMTGACSCGGLSMIHWTAFLLNSDWRDLTAIDYGWSAKTGTESQRMADFDKWDSAAIASTSLLYSPYSESPYVYHPIKQSGCEQYLDDQYRIVLFDIGDGYVVKLMFYDYHLGHTVNYSNWVYYMFEVYYVGP